MWLKYAVAAYMFDNMRLKAYTMLITGLMDSCLVEMCIGRRHLRIDMWVGPSASVGSSSAQSTWISPCSDTYGVSLTDLYQPTTAHKRTDHTWQVGRLFGWDTLRSIVILITCWMVLNTLLNDYGATTRVARVHQVNCRTWMNHQGRKTK